MPRKKKKKTPTKTLETKGKENEVKKPHHSNGKSEVKQVTNAWSGNTVARLRASIMKLDEEDILLDEYLRSQGLVRKHTPKDGACMFRAFAEQVFGTQALHHLTRSIVVEYLLHHSDEFAPFVCTDGIPYSHYCEAMKKWNTWGGEVEIQAFSRARGVDVIIYTSGSTTEPMVISNCRDSKESPVMLCYSKGNHYDSVYSSDHVKNLEHCQNIVYDLVDKVLGGKGRPQSVYKNIEMKWWIKAVTQRQLNDESVAKSLGSQRGVQEDIGWGGFYYKKTKEGGKRVNLSKSKQKQIEEQKRILQEIQRVRGMNELKEAMQDKESHFPVLGDGTTHKKDTTFNSSENAWGVKKEWSKILGSPIEEDIHPSEEREKTTYNITELKEILFEQIGGYEGDISTDQKVNFIFGNFI